MPVEAAGGMPSRYPAKRPWIFALRIVSESASVRRTCRGSSITRITSYSRRSVASPTCESWASCTSATCSRTASTSRSAKHGCDTRRLRFDDEYDIKVRVGEIRHSSWTLEYAIDRADGTHCADASTIQVMLDRSMGRPTRIPVELRATLAAARGREDHSPR